MPPGNPTTTATTTPKPHRRHGERGHGVETEATGIKRKVTKKEQRYGAEIDVAGAKREVIRSEGTVSEQNRLTHRATASRPRWTLLNLKGRIVAARGALER